MKIIASDGVVGDFFGLSVSMTGNMVAVGAYGDDLYRGEILVYIVERTYECAYVHR